LAQPSQYRYFNCYISFYMETKPYSVLVNTPALKEFLTAAKQFCLFVEDETEQGERDYLLSTQKILLQLYQNAIAVEWVELTSDNDYETTVLQEKIRQNIASMLKGNQYYWIKNNPIIIVNEPMACGDLTDDLLDIYTALKQGLNVWQLDTDDSRENALWQFKFDFDSHWGQHCVNALYAIHYFIAARKI
jgi:hypothetical protein